MLVAPYVDGHFLLLERSSAVDFRRAPAVTHSSYSRLPREIPIFTHTKLAWAQALGLWLDLCIFPQMRNAYFVDLLHHTWLVCPFGAIKVPLA